MFTDTLFEWSDIYTLPDELKYWFENNEFYDDYIFSQWDEFKKVITLLNSYKYLKQSNSLNIFDDNELSKAANLLINRIKKQYIDYTYKNDSFSAKNLKNDLIEMFASFDIENYSIILTTSSKFSHKINTLTNSNYIWNIKSFEKAIVFLDEFDSQKSYYLKSIINNSLSTTVDLIELFRLMFDTFENMSYENKFDYDKESFLSIKDKFGEIYTSRNLKYILDTNLLEFELDNIPILIDSSFSTFNLQKKSNKLFINIDDKNEQLNITIEKSDNSYTLSELLKDISQVINRYIIFCRNHVFESVKKFQEKNIEEKKQVNQENFINAKIHDNIKIFGLSKNDTKYKYLMNQIKNDLFLRKKFKKLLGKRKWNFYQNGFSLINISKTYLDSNITDVEYFNLSKTPESMLIEASEQCMLVGVSATSNVNTVINNFDIEYLKFETSFYQPSLDEIQYMQELYLISKEQNNRNFNIHIINDNLNFDEKLKEFCSRNYPNSFMNMYCYIKSTDIKPYVLDQYFNFIDCYKRFLEEDSIHSLLYFSNRYIRNNNEHNKFNYQVLMQLLVSLIENIAPKNQYIKSVKEKIKIAGKDLINKQIKENTLFFEYNGDNEKSYDTYVKENSNDSEKLFVYANYKRIGSGKNLEYSTPKFEKKDFDAIFLEKPTNILLRNVSSNEEKLVGIFQIESLFRNYILSYKEYSLKLKKLISGESAYKSPGFYSKSDDNIEASMQVIIQAIGRLHRTNSKSDMFIFIDNSLVEIINSFENRNIPLLPSTLKIKEYCSSFDREIDSSNNNLFENELNQHTNEFRNLISYSLEVFKKPTNMKNLDELKDIWSNIRRFVLKHPTIESLHSNELKKYLGTNNISHINVKGREYSCFQVNDYKSITLTKESGSYEIEVSETAANLHLIKNCKELNDFALNNEIALEFKYNNLLIPIVFNNIYKGALGEQLGKYIIEKYCDIKLEELSGELDEKYETFDFKNEKYSVYFDFKYYSQKTLYSSRQEIIDKVRYKLKSNKFKKSLIINIFAEAADTIPIVTNDDVVFIPYLVNSSNENNPYIDISMIETIKEMLKC
jgi:hypothetical protein